MKNRDYYAFEQAGMADAYDAIGGYHLFMVCDAPNPAAYRGLPAGYSFRLCRPDELNIWAHIATEEIYASYALAFYNRTYAPHADDFFRRCTFVCDGNGNPVATSMIWRSYGQINTVGWTRVLPNHEGKGIGRALLSEILRTAEYPVYLHTQPTSICAIKLYADFGFKFITNAVIGHRRNDLAKSLPYVERVMSKIDFARLQFTTADTALHRAALQVEQSEF